MTFEKELAKEFEVKSNESKKALADHQSTMPPSSRMARTNILQGILGTLELDTEEMGH